MGQEEEDFISQKKCIRAWVLVVGREIWNFMKYSECNSTQIIAVQNTDQYEKMQLLLDQTWNKSTL